MKEYLLDTHSSFCPCNKKRSNVSQYGYDSDFRCELHPERFLFYAGNQFHLITHYRCIEFGDKYELKIDIINRVIEKSKIFDYWDVCRAVDVEKDLRDFRIRNKALRKHIQQVNYLYRDGAKKEYALTTKTNYLDAICDGDKLEKAYEDAEKYLKKLEYGWLLDELWQLYLANRLHNNYEAERIKTIDHLTKQIRKSINQ